MYDFQNIEFAQSQLKHAHSPFPNIFGLYLGPVCVRVCVCRQAQQEGAPTAHGRTS